MKKHQKNHFWNIALFTRFNLPILYLLSPIQRQEVRSVIKKTQQETQETKREKVKQEAAVTIPVKNYR